MNAQFTMSYQVIYYRLKNDEKDAEYQGYMRDELSQSRAAAINAVKEMLTTEESVSEAQIMAFMTVLNSHALGAGHHARCQRRHRRGRF